MSNATNGVVGCNVTVNGTACPETAMEVYIPPFYEQFFTWIQIPICIFGMVGNILSFLALLRDRTKQKTTQFLLRALAIADTFNLLCRLMEAVDKILHIYDWYVPTDNIVFRTFKDVSLCFVMFLSTWAVVLVTVERFIAVCYPLHVSRVCTLARVRGAFGFVVLFCAAQTAIFTLVYLGVLELHALHNPFLTYYIVICLAVPTIILVPLNVKIIYNLRRASKEHSKMTTSSSTSQNERGATLTLIVIVVVLVLCQTPTILIWSFWMEFWLHADSVCVTFLEINSASNFVIYFLLGKRFRKVLAEMLCCRGKKASSKPTSGMSNSITATSRVSATSHATSF